MSSSLHRFRRRPETIPRKATLGRVFNVTRETWKLADDPRGAQPWTELLVTGRTASEAADMAREAAKLYARHGFHKPSGSWWAADEAQFHRFVVHAGRRRATTALVLMSGLVGLAAVTLVQRRRRRTGSAAAGD
jgi:hypothetical protein